MGHIRAQKLFRKVRRTDNGDHMYRNVVCDASTGNFDSISLKAIILLLELSGNKSSHCKPVLVTLLLIWPSMAIVISKSFNLQNCAPCLDSFI